MKLIITIPEEKYRYIQELEQGITDYATTRMLYNAVKHGKPISKPYIAEQKVRDNGKSRSNLSVS